MKRDFKDIDRLFREAYERAEIPRPDENDAWQKMQIKMHRRRINTYVYATNAFVFAAVLISFLGLHNVLVTKSTNEFSSSRPNIDAQEYLKQGDSGSPSETVSAPISATKSRRATSAADADNITYSDIPVTHAMEGVKESEINLPPFKHTIANELLSSADKKQSITDIYPLDLPKKKSLSWALSTGIFLHNHLVADGKLMGSNIPSIGLIVSKNIRSNFDLVSGLRYVHRGNMDYRTFTKTREVYNQEEINIYTLYVDGTHWIEIPLGIQYAFPQKKLFVSAFLTTDILLFQSAKLGVKTEVPALRFESEERLKRAWNYDSGLPLVNMGFRSEIGTYFNAKNALNLFVKVSPYSGEANANISKKYGVDLGIEWRYYF